MPGPGERDFGVQHRQVHRRVQRGFRALRQPVRRYHDEPQPLRRLQQAVLQRQDVPGRYVRVPYGDLLVQRPVLSGKLLRCRGANVLRGQRMRKLAPMHFYDTSWDAREQREPWVCAMRINR